MPWIKGPGDSSRKRELYVFWIVILLLLGVACLVSLLLLNGSFTEDGVVFLGESLLSNEIADYRVDARPYPLPALGEGIIQAILWDHDPGATDLPSRVTSLKSVLMSPIPSATRSLAGRIGDIETPDSPSRTPAPEPTGTATMLPSQTPSPVPSLTPSITQQPTSSSTPRPTGTQNITPTGTATRRIVFTATKTLLPPSTRTPRPPAAPTPTQTTIVSPTSTPAPTTTVNPTATPAPAPTGTPTPIPTDLPLPTDTATPTPTYTPLPTDTATPTPTYTPLPTGTPTPTPAASPTLAACENILPGSLNAIEDSWVDQTNPSQNYGAEPTLYIRPTGGVDERALVRFDLSSLAGKTVLSAILYIYDDSGTGNYPVDVLQVTSDWSEMAVTWDNQPDTNPASIGNFTLTKPNCTLATYLNPSLVQSWVDNPALNFGVMLYPPSGAGEAKLSSREGANPPKLWVATQP
ncbi:MAG: DNRLRE domain-containing protein [Chloroflexi bacterium]|nr:DNRLRE domain-containing protein [Chloroflexota bacterium]